ncbi:MAG TPA: DinB family protein [Gemmatimonadales bacterium]
MNKAALDAFWDQFRQKYGVYLRLLEAFPEDQYHTHLVPGMRTFAELSVHISGTIVRDIAEGVAKGRITADEASEDETAARLHDRAALVAFARECFERADAAVSRIGDAELAAMVPTPWGFDFPGSVAFHVLNDEFTHHRGQLHVYARLAGFAPPFIWSYADNAPEFQPAGSRA